jgi:transcriptional regulator with XRE-family HTH domain
MVPIVPLQCWLARVALGWSMSQLARAAGVSPPTVRRFECGAAVRASIVEAIQRTLETAGVVFIEANDGGSEIRLRSSGEVASVPPPTSNEYHVVVTQSGLSSWEWEIYRDGIPLPVPLRDGFYRFKSAAEAAGRIAIREFLEALDREQNA